MRAAQDSLCARLGSTSFGVISNQSNVPRQLQGALKLYF
jgi:hypothetical protein